MRRIDSKYIKRKEYVKDRIEIEKRNALAFSFPERKRDFERRQRKLTRRAAIAGSPALSTLPSAASRNGNGSNEIAYDIAAQHSLRGGGFDKDSSTPMTTMEAFTHRQSGLDMSSEDGFTRADAFQSYSRFDPFHSQHDPADDYLELFGKDDFLNCATRSSSDFFADSSKPSAH